MVSFSTIGQWEFSGKPCPSLSAVCGQHIQTFMHITWSPKEWSIVTDTVFGNMSPSDFPLSHARGKHYGLSRLCYEAQMECLPVERHREVINRGYISMSLDTRKKLISNLNARAKRVAEKYPDLYPDPKPAKTKKPAKPKVVKDPCPIPYPKLLEAPKALPEGTVYQADFDFVNKQLQNAKLLILEVYKRLPQNSDIRTFIGEHTGNFLIAVESPKQPVTITRDETGKLISVLLRMND